MTTTRTIRTTPVGRHTIPATGAPTRSKCSEPQDVTVTNGYNWQTSWLGSFYQPTNSPLIHVGSTNANLVGLYHYTVTTNQVIEGTNTVSIGYHYVAVYSNGIPLDSNGDGIPDYLSDANGNGIDDPGETPWDMAILQQPLSQEVYDGDTVIFSVSTIGTDLTFQWTSNGVPVEGATSSSYTIDAVQDDDAGTYAVVVSNATAYIVSSNAVLTVDGYFSDEFCTLVKGQRQNYTFKSGVTYVIRGPVQLYGNSTIEGGTVIKLDHNYPGATLHVMGPLSCQTEPYYPAVLTSVDDDSIGVYINDDSSGNPQPYPTGDSYLDLASASNSVISYLHISYADEGVTTPSAGRLDLWDCQFVTNNSCVMNQFGGTDSFHNVLFAGCGEAVNASTNGFAVEAEQVTANVDNFWYSSFLPSRVSLTNSIVFGNEVTAPILSTVNVAFNPDPTNFQATGAGNYYLAATSPLHKSGSTGISPRLLTEFQHKTTQPPIAFPACMQASGVLTLVPQAQRYTNGAPDLGYYYDALDYTVAWITSWGTITVLPGTAIGFRDDPLTASTYTFWGFDLRENSSFISHGTPTNAIIFSDVEFVQEQQEGPCNATFVPDFEGDPDQVGPLMDFRFCNFYVSPLWYHVWSGYEEYGSVRRHRTV